MLQEQIFSLLLAFLQDSVAIGAILGVAGFFITLSQFILDYFAGSNVKLLETEEF